MNTRDHYRIGRRLALLLLAAAPLFAQCPTGTLYPGALDTNASLTVAKNNIITTLTVNQQVSDTVAIVASTTGWVANMMAAVDTGSSIEYEFVTSTSGANTLNVSRACEGSAAVVHLAGAPVDNNATAYSGHTALTSAVTAVETLIKAAPTAHSVPVAEGASPFNYLAPGTAGQLFTSNGAAADPTFQAFGPGTGLPTGTQTQFLGIKPNTGNNTTLQFDNLPLTNVNDYNFPAQTCNVSLICSAGGSSGGSLVIGNNTITMTPVPNGTNGTDTNHLLYVSGGVGTAEACLITGGSGTSGQASGTIIINCANTHSGAFTVGSATAGIQEAANTTAGIYIPDGTYNIFAAATFAGDATITCASNHAIIQGNSATQNMFVSITSTLSQRFRVTGCNLTTSVTKTAGDAIQLNGTGSTVNRAPVIDTVMLQGQFNGIHAVSAAYVTITNCRVILGVNYDVWLQDTFHTDSGDQTIMGSSFDNSVNTGTVIRYESGGGLKVVGNKIQNHAVGLDLEVPDGVSNTGQLVIVGNSFDGIFTSSAINLQRANTTGQWFDVDITGNYIGGNGTTPNCISIGNGVNGVQIAGNYLKNCVTGITLTGNAAGIGIQANYTNSTLTTGLSVAAGVTNVRATDNNWNVASACFSLAAPIIIQDRTACFVFSNLPTTNATNGSEVFCFDCNAYCTAGSSVGANCFRQNSTWVPAPNPITLINFIADTGAVNAIAATLTGVPLAAGLRVTVSLGHGLQAGANTFAYNGGAAVAIKSSRNTANNIATAYVAGGSISMVYDGVQWEDQSQ